MKSKDFRSSPLVLRNEFPTTDLGMPILKNVSLPIIEDVISCHDTRPSDKRALKKAYLVHFFKDDPRFEFLYEKPLGRFGAPALKRIAQYTAVCTPDFSVFPEMPLPVQQLQVFKSRWCGAFWESLGLRVIPTVTWSDERSFNFCFDGLPVNSVVAIGMTGCKDYQASFMLGYRKMLEVLKPDTIVCIGEPFAEMEGNIIRFPYRTFEKEA